VIFINEAEAMGLQVLPPDVQKSFSQFSIEDNTIRFGLLAVKNVGAGAVESIVEARQAGGPFKSFEEFFQRVDLHQANRKVMESLVKAGAFDLFSSDPAQRSRPRFLLELDAVMARTSKMREEAQAVRIRSSDGTKCPGRKPRRMEEVRERRSEGEKWILVWDGRNTSFWPMKRKFWVFTSPDILWPVSKRSSTSFPPIA